MIFPTLPGSQPFSRDLPGDRPQGALSFGHGQQSFEWVLRELESSRADRAAISFAATGTLGFERSAIGAQQIEPTARQTTELQLTSAPPDAIATAPLTEGSAPDIHGGDPALLAAFRPSAMHAEATLKRLASEGQPASPEPISSLRATPGRTAPRVIVADAEPALTASEPASLPDQADPAAAYYAQSAPLPASSHVSVLLQSAEGLVRAYVTLPAWTNEDIAQVRMRARYLLSSYDWADAVLRVRKDSFPELHAIAKERIHGR